MAQAAILDRLVTKIADVLRTVFSSYFVDIKCSCLVKCHCGMPLVVQSKISIINAGNGSMPGPYASRGVSFTNRYLSNQHWD